MADTFSKMNRDVTAPVEGVSATPRVFFLNKVISLARLHTLFKSIVMSKIITVFHLIIWALLNLCESS